MPWPWELRKLVAMRWQKAEVVLQRVLGWSQSLLTLWEGSRAKAFEAADSLGSRARCLFSLALRAPCRIQRFVRRRWRKRLGESFICVSFTFHKGLWSSLTGMVELTSGKSWRWCCSA